MAGESITQLIFFIGAVVKAVGVITAVTSNVQSITDVGNCKYYNTFITTLSLQHFHYNTFQITPVDKLQNEGIQSRTIKCNPNPDDLCAY